jgi:dihydrofolate synthase/folylpolyglutamate synthase
LQDWLAYLETLHPKAIDMGLERVRTVAARLGLRANAPVITVAGTNGKGSTCAMLESILTQGGYRVGLYTSPHLVRFTERARIAQAELEEAAWLMQFERIEAARRGAGPGQEPISLTYFEFTTLAALALFEAAKLDVWVLEVGMGGRLDAVNIVDADCAIVTSVDIDHAQFLGPTREHIGWEKAHVYRSGRPAICSDPVPPARLVDYATSIGADLWLFGRDFNYSGDRQQWAYGGRGNRKGGLAYPALRGANQLLNAAGVLAALEALRLQLPVSQQAIRSGFALVDLPGRFQVLPGRPAIVLDVAHNPHAAGHLASNLDGMGFYPRTFGIVGMMADKDMAATMHRLAGKIDDWMLCALPTPRAASPAQLQDALLKAYATPQESLVPIEPLKPGQISQWASPEAAYASARERAEEGDRIVVFGSFLTVAPILALPRH